MKFIWFTTDFYVTAWHFKQVYAQLVIRHIRHVCCTMWSYACFRKGEENLTLLISSCFNLLFVHSRSYFKIFLCDIKWYILHINSYLASSDCCIHSPIYVATSASCMFHSLCAIVRCQSLGNNKPVFYASCTLIVRSCTLFRLSSAILQPGVICSCFID